MTTLAHLQAIDPAIVSEAARRSLGAAVFRLEDWSVAPLRHEAVLETTGGLFRFRGHGWDGSQTQAWSVVLKLVNQPEDDCADPRELCYWPREMRAFQSGLLDDLPGGIRAPRCYGVSEQAPGGWIWLEDIPESQAPWELAQYQQAARGLGRFAGAYLTGAPIPRFPWLCPSLFRAFYADGDWWAKFTHPASPNNAWQRPSVQQVYSEALRERVLRIWAEKWQWIAANERLPQVFCHNDAHRRNLMFHQGSGSGQDLVAIDWALCGPGGLGNDLGELVGTSLSYFAFEPSRAADLETAVLAGYRDGLRESGWTGDERLARLGYLVALALYWGGTLPCEIALAQPGETKLNAEAKYGRSIAAALPGWKLLAEFALDRADEARYWMGRLAA